MSSNSLNESGSAISVKQLKSESYTSTNISKKSIPARRDKNREKNRKKTHNKKKSRIYFFTSKTFDNVEKNPTSKNTSSHSRSNRAQTQKKFSMTSSSNSINSLSISTSEQSTKRKKSPEKKNETNNDDEKISIISNMINQIEQQIVHFQHVFSANVGQFIITSIKETSNKKIS